MPARLSGVFDWSGGILGDGAPQREWGVRYPAPPPWERTIHRLGGGLVVIDTCGGASLTDCLAEDHEAGLTVAGTIRLDDAEGLRDQVGLSPGTSGDAGLILAAYRRWGPALFSRLAGDFSFVVWDDRARAGHLVRDPFGVRRLQYAGLRGGLLFSTDVEGILAWHGVDRTPDEVTILDNLLGRYRTRDRTFFRAVKRVPPGHHVVTHREGTRLVLHRHLPKGDVRLRSLREYAEAFRFELARSVKQRLPATGSVACHVSGGLDSMSIAALSRAELRRQGRSSDLALVSARFIGWPADEGGTVHELARGLGVPVSEWDGRVPETSDLEEPRLAWPFGRSSIAGARQGDLTLASQAGASILFSGSGGNQMAVETAFFRDAWDTGGLPGYARAVLSVAGERPWRWPAHRLRRVLSEARRVIPVAFAGETTPVKSEPAPPSWLGPRLHDAWSMLPEVPPAPVEHRTASWMADAVWEELVEDPVHVWTLEHEDARATEQGLEFRFPYLSWALLRLTLSIPPRMRAPTSVDRRLQRSALQGVLPERLRLRNTFVNFNESIMLNTQGALTWIEALLLSGTWASEGFVRREPARASLRDLSASIGGAFTYERAERWREIRDVAALEAWLRRV